MKQLLYTPYDAITERHAVQLLHVIPYQLLYAIRRNRRTSYNTLLYVIPYNNDMPYDTIIAIQLLYVVLIVHYSILLLYVV